ncbi:MAG: CoB--CoM heterodisulfide reductase iron-sulfur subunit A family protein, partial [Thermodesulfobacteria bacterium]|nr:CoB--CoM heterodisulfide reductase iron-sulfur subunit A family protein [Thermodesulfobacteriota bacterium]
MSPMLAQLGLDKNIEILTRAHVVGSSPTGNGYLVRIKQKPRFVDSQKCVACGLCETRCPANNTGLSRKHDKKGRAIYLPAINGVPRGYAIDENICLFFKDGSCRLCERVCPKGAVNLNAPSKEMEIEVQGVILAPGASLVDPGPLSQLGYNTLEDVLTSLEFEALMNPGSVTQGKIIRPSSGSTPRSIAWIQCVGSRQTNLLDRPYCSGICCTAAIKQALTAKHLLGPNLDCHIYFTDVMTHQKGAERYYQNALASGVRFIRSRPFGVTRLTSGSLAIETYSPAKGRMVREYDMVVLSTGLEIGRQIRRLAHTFGIETDCFGFNLSGKLESEATT